MKSDTTLKLTKAQKKGQKLALEASGVRNVSSRSDSELTETVRSPEVTKENPASELMQSIENLQPLPSVAENPSSENVKEEEVIPADSSVKTEKASNETDSETDEEKFPVDSKSETRSGTEVELEKISQKDREIVLAYSESIRLLSESLVESTKLVEDSIKANAKLKRELAACEDTVVSLNQAIKSLGLGISNSLSGMKAFSQNISRNVDILLNDESLNSKISNLEVGERKPRSMLMITAEILRKIFTLNWSQSEPAKEEEVMNPLLMKTEVRAEAAAVLRPVSVKVPQQKAEKKEAKSESTKEVPSKIIAPAIPKARVVARPYVKKE